MHVHSKSPFADLLNEGQAAEVSIRFEQIIMESFATDAGREAIAKGAQGRAVVTTAEVKRRFNILADWFKVFRGDMGWSLKRCLDELPRALRAKLDGEIYVPDKRASWAPQPEQQNGG